MTDDLALLREMAADCEPPTDEARMRARADLLARAHPPRPAVPRRRAGLRPRRGLLASAAAAALLAVIIGLFAGDQGSRPVPPLEEASANPVLERGARRAASQPAPPRPRGDRYIYAREVLRETPVGGGPTEEFVDESWRSVDNSGPTRTSERGRSWISGPSDWSWPPSDPDVLERLPTEPDALRRAVVDRSYGGFGGAGNTARARRETEVSALLMLLRGWRVMPPDLRAGIFRALAVVPGIRVDRHAQDARGRTGVAIGAPDVRGATYEIIVDRESFEYLGMRGLSVRNDGVEVRQVTALVGYGVVDEIDQRPADQR